MRCPWLHRKSLAEKGNETVSGIQGNLWGLLLFMSFQPSFHLTDMKINLCWCRPASNPGRIVLTSQASRTISRDAPPQRIKAKKHLCSEGSTQMYWCRWTGDLRKHLLTCTLLQVSDPMFVLWSGPSLWSLALAQIRCCSSFPSTTWFRCWRSLGTVLGGCETLKVGDGPTGEDASL